MEHKPRSRRMLQIALDVEIFQLKAVFISILYVGGWTAKFPWGFCQGNNCSDSKKLGFFDREMRNHLWCNFYSINNSIFKSKHCIHKIWRIRIEHTYVYEIGQSLSKGRNYPPLPQKRREPSKYIFAIYVLYIQWDAKYYTPQALYGVKLP